jgi:predicted permease
MDEVSDRYLSGLLLKVTLPAAMIVSAVGQDTSNQVEAFYVLAVASAIFILAPILANIFQKFTGCDDIYKLMLTYPNLGFMGFPIIMTMYGQLGLFYASLFVIVFNISIFSYGISVLNNGQSLSLKQFINPGIIAALIALVIFVFNIPLPVVITKFLSSIGSITSPLAMMILGSTVAAVDFKQLFNSKLLYVFSACKLIIWPGLIWLVLHLFIDNPMIIGISTILMSLPVAGNVSMLSITYGGNTSIAAKGTGLSTLLSLITIPIYMYLFAM